jgi:hypothetical protein
VTETAGGGGAPWAAATLHDTVILSAQRAAFRTRTAGIDLLLAASVSAEDTPICGNAARDCGGAQLTESWASLAHSANRGEREDLGNSIHAGAPQRSDGQKGKRLRGVFLGAQPPVPEDAEPTLAHGDNLRGGAVERRLHVCAHHPLPVVATDALLVAHISAAKPHCGVRQ